MTSPILITKQDGVVTITLNRPDKKNAMSFEMMRELIEIAKDIRKDKTVRAVIITGGTDFCSGLDLSVFGAPRQMAWAMTQLIKPAPSLFQEVCLIWHSLPVPVIAVIDGVCLGAGLQLALGADIRISTSRAKFAILEVKWGLVADMGLTHTAKLMRADHLKELAMTARVIGAAEAGDYKLITHIDDEPMAKAQSIAKEITTRSPDAVYATKALINGMMPKSHRKLYQEKLWQIKLILGANRKLAIKKTKDDGVEFLKRQFK